MATYGLKAQCRRIPDEQQSVDIFLRSLERLRNSSPSARAKLMRIFENMVLHDGVLAESEVAIMRLFSILLRSPLPGSVEKPSVDWA